jgi:hypothetical protein
MGLFSKKEEESMPPIFLEQGQEYTDEGYLITRDKDGEIKSIVNWQDAMEQVQKTDQDYIPLVKREKR